MKQQLHKTDLRVYASDYIKNGISYISRSMISKGLEYIDTYKVIVSKTSAEHAGEPSKDGQFTVLPKTMRVLDPQEICTQSYFLVGSFKNKNAANNLFKYLQTRFVRFLMLMTLSGYSLSQANMSLVPYQEFEANKDIDWAQSVNAIDH